MREIKFRAWEKSTRRMILDAHMEYDTITDTRYADAEPDSVVDQPSGTSFGFYLGDDDYIVMQFTGLHDKNGREIYDGDVLQADGARGVAVFFNGAFCYADGASDGPKWFLTPTAHDSQPDEQYNVTDQHDLAIIGNIHENPELLE